jgi:hypothetical protein
LVRQIRIDRKMSFDGSIMDIESTHYEAARGELITAGFLSANGFTIFQRVKLNDADFKAKVAEEMEAFRRPLYAFNKKCEEGFCGRNIDFDLQHEREAAYSALKNEGLLEHYNSLCDPLFNEEVPEFWRLWMDTGSLLLLSKIMRHNYCCLAKEYYLKLRRMDKTDPERIVPFLSSAAIEKIYIRPALNINLKSTS